MTLKDKDLDINWNSLDVPDAKELAETNEAKARTDLAYQSSGALDAYDIRARLIEDEDSGYSGIESVERPEEIDLEPEPTIDPFDADSEPKNEPKSGQDQSIGYECIYQKGDSRGWYVYDSNGNNLGGPYSNDKKARNKIRGLAENAT